MADIVIVFVVYNYRRGFKDGTSHPLTQISNVNTAFWLCRVWFILRKSCRKKERLPIQQSSASLATFTYLLKIYQKVGRKNKTRASFIPKNSFLRPLRELYFTVYKL